MTLYNITISKLFTSPGDTVEFYFNVLKHMTPKDVIVAWPREHRDPYTARPLSDLEFSEIAEIKRKINNLDGMFYAFEKVFGIEKDKLLKVPVKSFFPALNWIRDELNTLIQRENDFLKSEFVDSTMIQAGIDKLDKFREWNALKSLGKEYGMLPEDLQHRKYKHMFTDLYHGAVNGDIQHRYMELVKQKK